MGVEFELKDDPFMCSLKGGRGKKNNLFIVQLLICMGAYGGWYGWVVVVGGGYTYKLI